jgi:hypothetical protein
MTMAVIDLAHPSKFLQESAIIFGKKFDPADSQ